ncbi:hypothetical protein B2J86_08155 [Acidovorax sp. SRB_14]|nr:hypothetical protein [Acidovorax sp. SRB_14]
MLEPTRFALVIGNADYGEYGNLPTLGSPCSDDKSEKSDTKVVADALTAANWSVDTVCNLTTDQLENRITKFNNKVRREPRAFGIIYFSGHGAEVAGTNYLFGVDANVNVKVEFDTYKENPNAILFGGSAVPLDRTMRQIEPLWNKAVAVFIDACRTNPILDKLRDAGLDLIRYPAKASEPYNILYNFSTVAGEPSPDGAPGGITRYARVMASVIRAQTTAQPDELDHLISAIGKGVIVDSRRRQLTGRAGIIFRPPRFCIRGCPTLEEDWKTYYEEFGPITRQKILTSFVKLASTSAAPNLWRVSAKNTVFAQAAAPPDLTHTLTPAASAATAAVPPPTRKVRFDILYCAGDAATDQRRVKSEGIREHLIRLTGTNSPVGGFEVGEVRLIPVPPAVNQALYKARDSVLTFNRDSPAQKAWATSLQSNLVPQVRIEEKPGSASDYMTILVCDGAMSTLAGPTIYVQAATREQVGKASALGVNLAQQLPNAKVAKGIEVIEKSPNETEIRYFSKSEADDAAEVARAIQEILNRKVKARFVPGYHTKLNGARLIEVWIGKKESPQ